MSHFPYLFIHHNIILFDIYGNFLLCRVPEWVDKALESKDINYLASLGYKTVTWTTEMKKIRAGFLLKDILDRFKEKAASRLNPDYSFWLYMTQGTMIVNLLNSLNMYEVSKKYRISSETTLH